MSLSIIIPTIGRSHLWDTLNSIARQLKEEDEVIVIGDGPQPHARAIAAGFGGRFRYLETEVRANDWGGTPRNHGIVAARGAHLAFMDDDDIYLPGAFKAFRAAMQAAPNRIHVFRMVHHDNVIWTREEIRPNNVSTQMFLLPNAAGAMPVWGAHYSADCTFIKEAAEASPGGLGSVVWRPEIVACLTEHREGIS